jgi:hypothetical protein
MREAPLYGGRAYSEQGGRRISEQGERRDSFCFSSRAEGIPRFEEGLVQDLKLPTEIKVESGTSQSKSGTSVN